MSADKLAAYQTLHTCLVTIARLMAPYSPFYADKLFIDLMAPAAAAAGTEPRSVHLSDFPSVDESLIDADLEERMRLAQVITSLVLSLRRKINIKVRQPLSTLMIPVVSERQRQAIEAMAPLILSEVNVKKLKFVASDEGILVKRIKPDFKKLGPKFGKQMKAVAQAVAAMSQAEINALDRDGFIELGVNGENCRIDVADVEIHNEDIPGWLVANEGAVTVALDVTIPEELRREGVARELVNRIQNIRKSRDYAITDRINVVIAPGEFVDGAVADFADYIGRQVLAASIETAPVDAPLDDEVLEIDGNEVRVKVTPA